MTSAIQPNFSQEERQVEHADEERQGEDQRETVPPRRDGGQGRRREHDHGGVGPHDEEPGAAEDGVGDERQRQRVQADHRIDAEDPRVGEPQRDEHRPGGGARHEVAREPRAPVRRQPLDDRGEGAHGGPPPPRSGAAAEG